MLAARPSFAAARIASGATQQRLRVRMMATDKVDMIKTTVSSNKVVVFSKEYCPYCTRVKQLFKELKVDFKVLELDQMGAEGAAIQDSLQTVTGRRTVPQVFIGNKFVGGCDDTMAIHSQNKLIPMFKEAGVAVA